VTKHGLLEKSRESGDRKSEIVYKHREPEETRTVIRQIRHEK
jgi:hypothetical protein